MSPASRTLVLCLIGASFLRADEASRLRKADEFLRISQIEQTLDQVLNMQAEQLRSGVIQKMLGFKLTDVQDKSMREKQDRLLSVFRSIFSWQKMRPGYVRLYADAYTEAELDDLLVFYKSSTGQSMLKKNPELMRKSSDLVQQSLAELIPAMQKVMKEFESPAGSPTAKP